MKTMWTFKTRNFKVEWRIERDAFDGSYMDAELAAECKQKIRSVEWACFTSEICVTFNGRELAVEYLGNSVYANPAEFRDHFGMRKNNHGSYFSDMVREAVRKARMEFERTRDRLEKEFNALSSIHISQRG